MNYGELKTLVSSYLKRTDLEPFYDQFRDLAEEFIGKSAKLGVMEVATEDLEGTWTNYIELPSDWALYKSVQSGSQPLDVYTMAQLRLMANSIDSTPFGYAIDANRLNIRNGNSDIYTTYYARPGGLTSDTSTNAVLTSAGSLYLFAMLAYAARNIQDDNLVAGFQTQYGAELGFFNELDANARMSGSAPQIKGV